MYIYEDELSPTKSVLNNLNEMKYKMTYKIKLNILNHGIHTQLVSMSGSQIGIFYPNEKVFANKKRTLNLKIFNYLSHKKEKLEKKMSFDRKIGLNDDLTEFKIFLTPNQKFLNIVTVFNPTIQSSFHRKNFDFMMNFFGLPYMD